MIFCLIMNLLVNQNLIALRLLLLLLFLWLKIEIKIIKLILLECYLVFIKNVIIKFIIHL